MVTKNSWNGASRGVALALALAIAGCAYFNALYNANRLFDRGRKEIRAGNESSGRTALAEAIRKAERALENHPESRWADDALLLIVRARLLRGEYAGAAEAANRLEGMAESDAGRRRAAALRGQALVALGEPERADSLLSFALDGPLDERDRATSLAARAEARRRLGRRAEADADYVEALRLEPEDPNRRLARFHLLLEAGRPAEATAEFHRLIGRSQAPTVEEDIVAAADSFARRAPEAAARALAPAAASELRSGARARLIVLRGRLVQEAGDPDSARADYRRAIEIASGTGGAVAAYLALARLEAARGDSIADLTRVRDLLARATSVGAGREVVEARRLSSIVDRTLRLAEAGDVAWLAAAEMARDSLGAPYLARAFFLRFAEELPDAVWTPKAILAALAVGPYHYGAPPGPGDEALRRRLHDEYAENPYVAAVGEASGDGAAFAAAERMLQQRMRVLLTRLGVATGARAPAVSDTFDEVRGRTPPP